MNTNTNNTENQAQDVDTLDHEGIPASAYMPEEPDGYSVDDDGYDEDGYDFHGRDRDGFNENGFDKFGNNNFGLGRAMKF